MTPIYLPNTQSMNNYAEGYRPDYFSRNVQPRQCKCGKLTVSYEITDQQDNDIIKILVLCEDCAKQQQNNQ